MKALRVKGYFRFKLMLLLWTLSGFKKFQFTFLIQQSRIIERANPSVYIIYWQIDSSLLYFIKDNLLAFFYFRKANGNPFRVIEYCQIRIFSLRSLSPASTGKTGSMVVAYSSVTSFINSFFNVGGTLLASLFSRIKPGFGEYVFRYTFPLHSPGRKAAKKWFMSSFTYHSAIVIYQNA